MRYRFTLRVVALLAVFALFATACTSDDGDGETTTTTAGSTEAADVTNVNWALPFLPDTLFVPAEWTTIQGAVVSLAQEGLLAFDDDLNLVPALAESWEQVDDLTYVYTLREGATFPDVGEDEAEQDE